MARDRFHGAVRRALEKGGWLITADPYIVRFDRTAVEIDLAAEQLLAAEWSGQKIVVEVKSFLHPSPIHDLKSALGQYVLYSRFLELTAPERKVYLAVSDEVYSSVFEQKAIQAVVEGLPLSLIAVNVVAEEIVSWIN